MNPAIAAAWSLCLTLQQTAVIDGHIRTVWAAKYEDCERLHQEVKREEALSDIDAQNLAIIRAGLAAIPRESAANEEAKHRTLSGE